MPKAANTSNKTPPPFKKILEMLLFLCSISLALASLIGFLGHSWWLFDLANHFRFHYLLVAAVLLILSILFRSWRVMLFVIAIATLNLWQFQSFFGLPWQAQAQAPTLTNRTLKVLFSNILISTTSDEKIAAYIQQENPDVIFLAEIRPTVYEQLKERFPEYQYSFYQKRFHIFGIATFSKIQPEGEVLPQYYGKAMLPSLEMVVPFESKKIRLIGTHPYQPLGQQETQLRNDQLLGLADYVAEHHDLPLLVVGDFNSTSESMIFKEMKRRADLRDSRVGKGLQRSWPTQLPTIFRITIDHALHSEDVFITRREVGPDINSDHLPFVVELRVVQ